MTQYPHTAMNNLNINGPIRTASDHGTTLATRFSIYLGSMLNCSRMWSKVLLVTLFLVCSGTAQVKFTSASDIAAAATSSAATVSWTAMGDWTAKIDVDWLTFPISSGSAGSWGRTLNWGSNPTKQSRVGHLTIGTAVVTVTRRVVIRIGYKRNSHNIPCSTLTNIAGIFRRHRVGWTLGSL